MSTTDTKHFIGSAEFLCGVLSARNTIQRRHYDAEFPQEPPFVSFQEYKHNFKAQPNVDNSPWLAAGNYGKGGKPNYYYQDTPTSSNLWWQSRNSPLGFRLTYGVAKDTYINEFTQRYPNSKLDEFKKAELNSKIRVHLREIGYYKEAKKACGFKREQGEAILVCYRQGDGAQLYFSNKEDNVNYNAFVKPANIMKPIIRVEAISAYDYFLPSRAEFGKAEYFRVNFTLKNNSTNYFDVHPSRVVRWKNDDIDYDFFEQQSALRPCFSELQILNQILRSAGQAAHRWGIGIPTFYVKGVQDNKLDAVKTKIGNPLMGDFWIFQTEFMDKIEMNGVQGAMLDLAGMANMILEQIAAVMQIPVPILLGRVAGVVEGSVVNERQYFSTLVREQAAENDFHRWFFKYDPYIQELFAEYGIEDWEYDWGLRQEMTQQEKADLDMKKASTAISYQYFLSYDEIREYLGYANLSKTPFNKHAQSTLGITAEVIGAMIPGLGVIKQETIQQIVTTPAEKEAQNQAEQLGNTQNKPVNVARANEKQGKENLGTSSQALRNEKKAAWREGENDQILNELVKLSNQDLLQLLKPALDMMSLTKLSKLAGCHPDTIRNLINGVRNLEVRANEQTN